MALPIFGQPTLPTYSGPPLLAKGFRPFFLGAALLAALDMGLWLLFVAGGAAPLGTFDPTFWHAHELVFGFGVAVVAGFLLTAVANWTGRETLVGRPLGALVALWLAARIAFVVPALPPVLVSVLDLVFLPALAVAIARPIITTRNRRNYVMLAVLTLLFVLNLLMHLDLYGRSFIDRRHAALLTIDVLMFLIAFMAARIFPMFTRNATGVASIHNIVVLDRLALAALGAVVLTSAIAPATTVVAVVSLLAAALLVARSAPWGFTAALRDPLLWVLHAGHLFIVIGLVLRALSIFTSTIPEVAATHALTVGALGLTTLGMMARVALGHTGRKLIAPRPASIAFALVLAAALARTIGAIVEPPTSRHSAMLAGALWSLAFLLYAVSYARILLSRRADNKPG